MMEHTPPHELLEDDLGALRASARRRWWPGPTAAPRLLAGASGESSFWYLADIDADAELSALGGADTPAPRCKVC